jgi:hypothetical protein
MNYLDEFLESNQPNVDISNIDEYLQTGASLRRLVDEYKKYGSLCIGYDFDGTVYDYHQTGAKYDQVIDLLQDLKEMNCKLICWTAQNDLDFVEKFLTENSIPFDGINTDGINLGWESRKPFFSALLDDRAGLKQVYEDLRMLVTLYKIPTDRFGNSI